MSSAQRGRLSNVRYRTPANTSPSSRKPVRSRSRHGIEEEFVNQREIRLEIRTNPLEEKLMESPTSPSPATEMPTPVESDVEVEISRLDVEAEVGRLVEKGDPKPRIGSDMEQFKSYMHRWTLSSID